ncbi:MAG: hypothetical protein IJ558_08705 [Treponema sp.]|nr:hypothetical protein [Treponema sp.]
MENEKKEGGINLEEFMLRQLDLSLEMKSRLETKATGYLAVVALILGLVFQIITSDVSSTECLLFFFCKATVAVGTIIVIICAVMLFPRRIGYFSSKWLSDIYADKNSQKKSAREKRILTENQRHIDTNGDSIRIQGILNIVVSIFMFIMLVLFVIDNGLVLKLM